MEYAIVTLNIGRLSVDIELPRFMNIGELQEQIVLLLKQQYPGMFNIGERLVLLCDGNVLSNEKNLAYYKICTGDILEGISR